MNDIPALLRQIAIGDEALGVRIITPEKVKKRREHFVRVPWKWVEQLEDARYIATYRVALHVLYQHWKNRGAFTLSNSAIKGVSRHAKWRALAELELLGLISIERRPRRSPRITIHT